MLLKTKQPTDEYITGHALMVSLGFLLKELAYEHNLSVLVSA